MYIVELFVVNFILNQLLIMNFILHCSTISIVFKRKFKEILRVV